MILRLFGRQKRVEVLREEVQESFKHVRKDVNKIGDWIKHIDDKNQKFEDQTKNLQEDIKTLKQQIEEITETLTFLGQAQTNTHHRQKQTNGQEKQTSQTVHADVQTDVQTDILDRLTVMERAVVWTLLNAEVKMSHEDIATLLGKDKSTIRGQINAIKQKSPSLLQEIREQNGKKRLFIPDLTKKNLVKRAKLRIK